MSDSSVPVLAYRGFCPICESETTFTSDSTWYRDKLQCQTCPGGSRPRVRALALVLSELRPDWRSLAIHESSPNAEGISVKLKAEAPGYIGSHFFPGKPLGETLENGFRNEDLQAQTFAENTFDVVISLDVMEHVYDPEAAFREVYRTLKTGGLYICTFPVRKNQVTGMERRLTRHSDGAVEHHKEPEYHGNPIDPTGGSIVTVDYGYDVHQWIAEKTAFDVRVYRFADKKHGIIGEYTEVFVCSKW